MEMVITFPGGKKVNAEFGGHVVETDQRVENGGEGSAPEPFSFFLASLGTCAGIFALGFCQSRGLPTQGLQLRQRAVFDPETHRLLKVSMTLDAPVGFPEKYLPALRQSMENCSVKRVIHNPPEFDITVSTAGSALHA